MIECIRSSSWTGYMLMKVRHDLPEVGFVKVPCDDTCVRMLVDISAEHIVESILFSKDWTLASSILGRGGL